MRWLVIAPLLLLGCTAPRLPAGFAKGLNHVFTHRHETNAGLDDLSEVRARLQSAAEAYVEVVRGPGITPHRWRTNRVKLLHLIAEVQDHGMLAHPLVLDDENLPLQDWREFCESVASALSVSGVLVVGVDNEPDNNPRMTVDRYNAMLRVAFDEFHYRGILVSAPALGHGKAIDPYEFLGKLDQASFDVLTIHPYDRGEEYIRRCLEIVPDKPVVIEEHGARRNTIAEMRRAFGRFPKISDRIIGLYWYCDDDGTDWSIRGGKAWDYFRKIRREWP